MCLLTFSRRDCRRFAAGIFRPRFDPKSPPAALVMAVASDIAGFRRYRPGGPRGGLETSPAGSKTASAPSAGGPKSAPRSCGPPVSVAARAGQGRPGRPKIAAGPDRRRFAEFGPILRNFAPRRPNSPEFAEFAEFSRSRNPKFRAIRQPGGPKNH